MSINPLTPAEAKDLRKLESRISGGVLVFHAVGRALAEISERKLYRAKYRSFAEYCAERWGFGRAHAYRLIGAAAVLSNIEDVSNGDTELPCEGVIRPLTQLPADLQADAYRAAKTEPDQPPTSERTKSIVQRVNDALATGGRQEAARVIRDEEAATKRRAEKRQGDALVDEEQRRWRKVLLQARLCRKDARGIVGAEDVIEWAERIMQRAANELNMDRREAGLREAA